MVLGLLLGVPLVLIARGSHEFLCVTDRVDANVLVVEGWLPDYALEKAIEEFTRKDAGYEMVVTTGGPLLQGFFLSEYRTYAELSGATLAKLWDFREGELKVVSAAPTFRRRTHESAVAVKGSLGESGMRVRGVNVLSLSTHSRRTRLIFHRELGDSIPVGVICVPSQDYEVENWWRTSEGVKGVITEGVGWFHEKFL